MLRVEGDALRVGNRVVVHDPLGTEFPLLSGTVAMVQTKRYKRSANGVGIRVPTDRGRHRVVWPSFLAAPRSARSDRGLLAMRGPRRDSGTTAVRFRVAVPVAATKGPTAGSRGDDRSGRRPRRRAHEARCRHARIRVARSGPCPHARSLAGADGTTRARLDNRVVGDESHRFRP